MDRLTHFIAEINGTPTYVSINYQRQKGGNKQDFINALGLYEDTRLKPDEILTGLELAKLHAALEQLKRYEQLKAEGRMFELPCKVGGAVYVIYSAEVEYGGKAVIEYCTVSEISTHRIWIENNSKAFKYYDIGKIVFLTLAEAEKALEVLNNDKTN